MSRNTTTQRLLLGGALLVAVGALLALAVSGRRAPAAEMKREPMRVLFLGNSYTFANDLPAMFAALARAGGHTVETRMVAEGGWRLADHAEARGTTAAIEAGGWHYVVLQEQSQIPAVAQLRAAAVAPAARALAGRIRASGATPLLFMTWGHRTGWPDHGLTGYAQMQAALHRGYLELAAELRTPVAPVGAAWAQALREHPELALWEADGSHPATQGSYLAACVFYASVFGESPEGLGYSAGLPRDVAMRLQSVAARVVLDSPEAWNMP